jgi:putative RecB family exonuclease
MPDYRSVSQRNSYDKCPYAYYLERIVKAWQRPAAWLPQGTAFHEAAEHFEKSNRTLTLEETQDVFREAYSRETNEMLEDTPNMEYWARSGPYDGEADIERRFTIGLNQVAGYLDYIESHPEDVLWITPDGTPAIELGFDIDLDGVRVKGYIDQVLDGPRDLKTGNKPGDDFQIATYDIALLVKYGVQFGKGDYWMAGSSSKRKNPVVVPHDVSDWTVEKVTEEFHRIDEGIKAGNFPADPERSKCQFCSVRTACSFSAY